MKRKMTLFQKNGQFLIRYLIERIFLEKNVYCCLLKRLQRLWAPKKMNRIEINKSILAGFFSAVTIGALTLLTYKTEFGVFLIASFGSSMVLLFGYPESPFAQPKNIFFGHLLTSLVGMFFLYLIPLPLYIIIPISVGFGVGLMILFKITHPPAGGNPIIVIMGSVSPDYLINPIIIGTGIILIFGVVLNRLILKKKYPM